MQTCAGADKLALNSLDLNDISRELTKMPDRHCPRVCAQTLDLLIEIADSKMVSADDKEVLHNLRKVMGMVASDLLYPKPRVMDTLFFPNKANVKKIVNYISKAKKNLIICIFTMTNDDLAKAVIDRHNAGVNVRVISDDECASAKGSDIERLANAGIPVRTDDSPQYHMHDKFMVVDKSFVMTGSFNWTFSAGSHN